MPSRSASPLELRPPLSRSNLPPEFPEPAKAVGLFPYYALRAFPSSNQPHSAAAAPARFDLDPTFDPNAPVQAEQGQDETRVRARRVVYGRPRGIWCQSSVVEKSEPESVPLVCRGCRA
jgi:hypothetical protein